MSLIKPRGAAPAVQNDMPAKYFELRDRIAIDKDRIDVAVQEQPQLFFEVAEQQALATSQRDMAKDDLARKDAAIARDVRAQLEKAGQRATEALVADGIMLHPDHIKASAHLATLKYQADRWWALREAFDHRLRMLRELANLYATNYFSSASAIRPSHQISEHLATQAKEKLAAQRKLRG